MAGSPYGFQPTPQQEESPSRFGLASQSGGPYLLKNHELWANPRSGQRDVALRNTLQTAATGLAEILGVAGESIL
eukprot:1859032-Alexandrium_andersonii.AAC.1